MQGPRRRIVYLLLYEAIAIAMTSVGVAFGAQRDLGRSAVLAVVTSAVAVLWNLGFNSLFERWEAQQAVRGRGVGRRIAHATLFEIGLVVMLVPVFGWWLRIGWWTALTLDLGLSAFFLVYTFVFTWCFDRLFGLPLAAGGPIPGAEMAQVGVPAVTPTSEKTASRQIGG